MNDPTRAFELVPATAFTDDALAELFGAVYADYFVPIHLDAAALRMMVDRFDLDLGGSRVVRDGSGRNVGVALLGVRGPLAWIGGMGVVPDARRGGLGRRLMEAVIAGAQARGCRQVQLEVLEQNAGAIALYRALGFQAWRMLDVWALAPAETPVPADLHEVPVAEARAWIVTRRTTPEPWQRADASLDRFDRPENPLRALAASANGVRTGAAVFLPNAGRASLLQMAAEGADPVATARALIAAAGTDGRTVRFLNVPGDHPAATALAAAGATLEARQHEMRLALAMAAA